MTRLSDISKDEFVEIYVTQQKTIIETAKYFNMATTSVQKLIKRFEIVKPRKYSQGYKNIPKDELFKFFIEQNNSIQLTANHFNTTVWMIQAALQFHSLQKDSKSIVARRSTTIKKKYGCTHYVQSKDFKEKTTKTVQQRYGVNHISQAKSVKEKTQLTFAKRYGGHPMHNAAIQEKNREALILKNADIIPQVRTQEQINITKSKSSLERFLIDFIKQNNRKPITVELRELLGYSISNTSTLARKLNKWRLYGYIDQSKSKAEIDLCALFPTDHVNVNDVIENYELDLYYPEQKLAIEFNGLYWHSYPRRPKKYHQDKLKACQAAGIRLIQIMEDEWTYTPELVIDKLNHIFGKATDKPTVGARKCKVKKVKFALAREFMNKNHIQGFCQGQHIGLWHEDKLVAVITVNGSQKSRRGSAPQEGLEISRFATDVTLSVPGAFSKLLKYLKTKTTRLYSYADLRWVDPVDNVYTKHGFKQYNTVDPAYWYWTSRSYEGFDIQRRYYRFNFTKTKIRQKFGNILDNDLQTEKDMMDYLGWYRIYDAGKISYELII